MKNILEELYYIYGNPTTIEGDSAKVLNRCEDKLCKRLKGKNRVLFYDYMEAYSEFTSLCIIGGFKQGVRVGYNLKKEFNQLKEN